VTATAAAAFCAVVWAFLPPRSAPPAPPKDADKTVTAAVEEVPVRAAPVAASPDPSAPARVAQTIPEVTPAKQEEMRPLPAPPELRVEMKVPNDEAKEFPLHVAKPGERHKSASEAELLADLSQTPEVGLGATGQVVLASYVTSMQSNVQLKGTPLLGDPMPMLLTRPELRFLPLRNGYGSQLNPIEAGNLDQLSRKLRVYLNTTASLDGSPRPDTAVDLLRKALVSEHRGQRPEWLRPGAVPTLLQMLTPEETPVRKLLVDLLAEVPDSSTTTALAQRAVFDLDADVRRAAVTALRKRPADVYRAVLLKALRYPWSPVADHAAEALVELNDKAAVPHLVSLLSQPDPTLPETLPNGMRVVREVVRVNHLTNCLMCHPPSYDGTGPVVGVDPVLNLPPTIRTSASAAARLTGSGSHNYGQRSVSLTGFAQTVTPNPLIVRGDITFFRQDFSVKLSTATASVLVPALANPVVVQPNQAAVPANPFGLAPVRGKLGLGLLGVPNPALAAPTPVAPAQRFDYLVRTRPVTPAQADKLLAANKDRKTYPQRDAVLFALRELTGTDAGETTQAWRDMFPRADTDAEASRLRSQLMVGDAVQQAVTMGKWLAQRSDTLNDALAVLIPDLSSELQKKVRDVLVDRLKRGEVGVLRKKIADDNTEMRRAALTACGQTKNTQLVPDLIELLGDADPADAVLIEGALRSVTGEQVEGVQAWTEWWEKNATE
jgi:HEAT repeat protein